MQEGPCRTSGPEKMGTRGMICGTWILQVRHREVECTIWRTGNKPHDRTKINIKGLV